MLYDWQKDVYEVLAIPVSPLYIQSLAVDFQREIIYGVTYQEEFVFRYDISTKSVQSLAYI